MPLLVVGSVALDCVETPTDKRDDVLGGSAVFFSYAASFFSPVQMIGTVGDDFPEAHTRFLEARGIDTSGIETIPGGKTFRWRGRYLPNMNDRETLEVHLNVFGEFKPKLNGSHRDSKFVFLGNASPTTQLSVLDQVPEASLTVADTGLGFGMAATAGTGVGLANIRERLQLLYGPQAALTVAANQPSGTVVTITVPYRTIEGAHA